MAASKDQDKEAARRKLMVGGAVLAVLAAGALYLNFGRGGGGPDKASLEAAQRTAAEMGADQPVDDPSVPVKRAPARPSALGR